MIKFVDIYQHSPVVRAALDKSLGKLYQVGWEDKMTAAHSQLRDLGLPPRTPSRQNCILT